MAFNSGIVASSYYVPEGKLTNEPLFERFGEEAMRKIADSSGIIERRVCLDGECASDLAHKAAEDLLSAHEIDRESVDLVLFATQTPDYLLPTTACLLQDRLGIPKTAGAFDINLGCSQYVYSVATAHSMIAAGLAQRALVMTGDTVSRIIHPMDRAVVPLFGDAGTATLIERVPEGQGFKSFVMGSDGAGGMYLVWPTSGMREVRTPETAKEEVDKYGSTRRRDDMYMDGAAIMLFTLKTVGRTVKQLLAKAEMSIEDVDLFIFHQASELIVSSAAKKLKLPPEKVHYKLHDVGNSGGSTVGIALTDAWLEGRVKPGMNIVMTAFGVGLSWVAALVRWPEHTLGPVCTVDFSDSPPRPEKQVVVT